MAAYVVNRMPCRKLLTRKKQTPEEYFSNKKCDLSELKLFGTKVMVLKPKKLRTKFEENSTEMVFVGYDECVKGYRCVNVKTRKMIVDRNVKFFESEKNSKMGCSSELCEHVNENEKNGDQSINQSIDQSESENDNSVSSVDSSEQYQSLDSSNESQNLESSNESQNETLTEGVGVNDDNTEVETDADDTLNDPNFRTRANTNNGLRSSSRSRTPFQPYQHMGHFAFFIEPTSELEPSNMKEAMNSENGKQWATAMNEEIESHKKNGTWQLVDLPKGRKPITAK